MELVCTVYVDRDEFGAVSLVIRDPNDMEYRDTLIAPHKSVDAKDIWYAALHESII